jgi:hypothetical protein
MEGSPCIAVAFSLRGISVIRASVVSISEAIEAAFWSAERVTLAGSRIPAAIRLTASSGIQATDLPSNPFRPVFAYFLRRKPADYQSSPSFERTSRD